MNDSKATNKSVFTYRVVAWRTGWSAYIEGGRFAYRVVSLRTGWSAYVQDGQLTYRVVGWVFRGSGSPLSGSTAEATQMSGVTVGGSDDGQSLVARTISAKAIDTFWGNSQQTNLNENPYHCKCIVHTVLACHHLSDLFKHMKNIVKLRWETQKCLKSFTLLNCFYPTWTAQLYICWWAAARLPSGCAHIRTMPAGVSSTDALGCSVQLGAVQE